MGLHGRLMRLYLPPWGRFSMVGTASHLNAFLVVGFKKHCLLKCSPHTSKWGFTTSIQQNAFHFWSLQWKDTISMSDVNTCLTSINRFLTVKFFVTIFSHLPYWIRYFRKPEKRKVSRFCSRIQATWSLTLISHTHVDRVSYRGEMGEQMGEGPRSSQKVGGGSGQWRRKSLLALYVSVFAEQAGFFYEQFHGQLPFSLTKFSFLPTGEKLTCCL